MDTCEHWKEDGRSGEDRREAGFTRLLRLNTVKSYKKLKKNITLAHVRKIPAKSHFFLNFVPFFTQINSSLTKLYGITKLLPKKKLKQ